MLKCYPLNETPISLRKRGILLNRQLLLACLYIVLYVNENRHEKTTYRIAFYS